jgi:predicted phosphoribosyltransferase
MPLPHPLFQDRREAGVALAKALSAKGYRPEELVILALPRGGVPVGFEVARALAAPLDVFVVRKLGVPGREELAMGAIASGGWIVLDRDTITALGIDRRALDATVRREAAEILRREQAYRAGRATPELRGRTVILVDDGLATGATMHAAVRAVREHGPAKVVVAVPVGSPNTCARLEAVSDDLVCLRMPEPFYGVGLWYEDFTPTSDSEVRSLLGIAGASPSATPVLH